MPLIETHPDAVARVYATSLFELAEAKGGREKVEKTLGELEEVVELARRDGRFNEFLSSRVLGKEARDATLTKIFGDAATGLTLRFLRLLNEKGRLGALIPIVSAFDSIVQERFGRVEVDVITASPVDAEALRSIKDKLSQTLNKDVIVHPYIDASMIGGVRLRIGDQLVDASVATRLAKLRDQLSEAGGAEVRARAGRIIEDTNQN